MRQQLVHLGEEDQAVRQDLTPERIHDTAFARRALHDDSARTARLQDIVDAHGWPDSARAGPKAAQAAFLILQHSPDHAFQKAMLPTIERLAEQGSVRRDHAALLIDRVLVQEGQPQRYGTQFHIVADTLYLDSVADPAGLEERREAMGLPTMEEYVRLMKEVYHAEVVAHPRR